MKAFSERNPAWIAVIGTVVLMAGCLTAFFSSSLPVIGSGTSYEARFTEAAGLAESNEVRIAGVKVGKVTGVRLDGTEVVVAFSVKDAWLGNRTTAAIKIKTLLGQKYLALDPAGDHELDPADPIPVERTTVPFDIAEATSGLATHLEEIDVDQLATSFRAMSAAFEDSPADVRAMLDGLSGLATTISGRDTELATLLRGMRGVSGTLADLDGEVGDLLTDGDLLLAELDGRREAMRRLLRGTDKLARQVVAVIGDNDDALAPALAKLDRVSRILQRNGGHIDEALRLLGPYYTLLTDATGSGPWVDGYLCGLFTEVDGVPRPQLDPRQPRNCHPEAGGGR
ncbi:MCE family protein [Nocardioides humilatus]|uniref:MCE family protein n=1 Tax=Nocardioides humilatus TaxID=2607660 RepID=A0A5B1LF87_9ACTN|nr:MCE family protein [Nocardioides humilatus]KAA1419345.1 MCE family protein [Nocardioides humilatus]